MGATGALIAFLEQCAVIEKILTHLRSGPRLRIACQSNPSPRNQLVSPPYVARLVGLPGQAGRKEDCREAGTSRGCPRPPVVVRPSCRAGSTLACRRLTVIRESRRSLGFDAGALVFWACLG